MRAAVFYGIREVQIEEIPRPRPQAGQVLIEIRAAGICGSDLHRYRGLDPWGGGKPGRRFAGHEFVGVVAELGPDVGGLVPGQEVAVIPMQLAGCGRCAVCRRGATQLCPRKGQGQARRRASVGFAEFDVATVEHAVPVPPALTLERAALADVYACAIHALHRAEINAVDPVLIIGSGAIGLALGQVVRAAGARRTILAGRRDEALALARRADAAEEVINNSRADFPEAVAEWTEGEGPRVVFEAVGGSSSETLRQAVGTVAPGGTVVILGAFKGDVHVPYREANQKEIRLVWSNGYAYFKGRCEFAIALDWLASNRVHGDTLITHRFPLSEIGEAFRVADDKATSGAVKVLVEPGT